MFATFSMEDLGADISTALVVFVAKHLLHSRVECVDFRIGGSNNQQLSKVGPMQRNTPTFVQKPRIDVLLIGTFVKRSQAGRSTGEALRLACKYSAPYKISDSKGDQAWRNVEFKSVTKAGTYIYSAPTIFGPSDILKILSARELRLRRQSRPVGTRICKAWISLPADAICLRAHRNANTHSSPLLIVANENPLHTPVEPRRKYLHHWPRVARNTGAKRIRRSL
jgi:hypothetical protein